MSEANWDLEKLIILMHLETTTPLVEGKSVLETFAEAGAQFFDEALLAIGESVEFQDIVLIGTKDDQGSVVVVGQWRPSVSHIEVVGGKHDGNVLDLGPVAPQDVQMSFTDGSQLIAECVGWSAKSRVWLYREKKPMEMIEFE